MYRQNKMKFHKESSKCRKLDWTLTCLFVGQRSVTCCPTSPPPRFTSSMPRPRKLTVGTRRPPRRTAMPRTGTTSSGSTWITSRIRRRLSRLSGTLTPQRALKWWPSKSQQKLYTSEFLIDTEYLLKMYIHRILLHCIDF